MLKTLMLFIASLIGSGWGDVPVPQAVSPNQGAAVCPAENAGLRERVIRLIQSPGGLALRQQDGWAHVTAGNLRVLDDRSYGAVCEWLRNNVQFPTADRITSYYVADGYYFVATERIRVHRPGTVLLGGWEPVIVIRNNLTFVGSYAS